MRVRARVNQADVNDLRVGQSVRVGLDAYPTLGFDGRIAQISPLGVTSVLSGKVRTFVVLVDVNGSHPNLMPDLSASLDVALDRTTNAIVIPRDALRQEGNRAIVRVKRGDRLEDRPVTVGATNAHEAMIATGLEDGAVIARNILNGSRSSQ
jgi:HlyD family secretion protein